MLAENGQRKEIDLVPPAAPDQQIPAPVCAQGVVNSDLADETEPLPGTSPLDEGLRNLVEEFGPQTAEVSPTPSPTGGEP